jgi:predicted glycosyltransferase
MKKKLLFYCQHVLGIGHYIRSRAIVQALADFDVCFVNGGEIVAGLEMPPEVEVVNLIALKTDANFRQLRLSDNDLDLDEVKAQRKEQLLATYDRVQPDAVVIELYPFGRRKFDFELLPLLEKNRAAARPAKVVCSLRDILVSKKKQAKFDDEACALMNQYFDMLLIHSDPKFQRLDETFPRVNELRCEVRYTGFVARQKQSDAHAPKASSEIQILVSIGGGRVGHELIDCAIEASALTALSHRMHILTGPHCPDEIFAQLQQRIAERPLLTIERFTPDFPAYLQRADLSISMAGYNTCMDIVAAGARAIVYPFTGHNNQEQMMRARKLEQLGCVLVLPPDQLRAERLAEMIEQALAKSPAPAALDLQGAEKTAKVLAELLQT